MQKLNKKEILSILNISFRLFIVCTIIAALVASVNFVTKDRIAAYELEQVTKALDDVFEKVVDAPEYNEIDTQFTGSVTGLYEVTGNSETIGYGVLCEPQGFKDVIQLLVAFDNDNAIMAVRVISHSETPGFGDRVKNEDWFAEQFAGKQNAVSLGGDGVNALSGATVSSKAVTKGVNEAIATLKKLYSSAADNSTQEVEADGK